ncbi:MAG: hypothetical protein QOI20_2150 [Acidimicrobiaceae bacterium]|jgi:uncharacterized membrane protein|nr:hypothetical protein [Acidimicrobiaceae bacterium]
MSTYEQGIELSVPVRTAYNQWTLFEEFPRFMEGVESVTQVTDTRNHWVADIGGVRREFDTEITEQTPDQRIAWRTVDGPQHAGVVTFHRLSDDSCRVMLQMEFDPDGFLESVADTLGFVRARVAGDMERFKEFIESRGTEEGGWRGEVPQHQVG